MAQPSHSVIGFLPGFIRPVALHTAYRMGIGGWSLFGLTPDLGESRWPQDLWSGDAEAGRLIANRRFVLAGCDISFSRHIGWYSKEGSLQWLRALHGFGWLRDVAAYNDSKAGAKLLREFINDWLAGGDHLHVAANETEVMGSRLSNWLIHGRFLQKAAPMRFRRRFVYSAMTQAIALHKVLLREVHPPLSVIKGVLLASLCLPQCGYLFHDAMRSLKRYLDGFTSLHSIPQGRNPLYLHETVRSLAEIQSSLTRLAECEEPLLDTTIGDIVHVLQSLLHTDGGFALFQGATEGDKHAIAETLKHIGHTPSAEYLQRMRGSGNITPAIMVNRTGYVRLDAGDSTVIIDAGLPIKQHEDPYYSTQAFEFSHSGQRYVVSCGAFIGNDPAWSRVVKTAAAHSTLCIDDRNPSAFDVQSETPHIQCRVEERDGYYFFEGVYDGYNAYARLTHTRHLLINNEGTRFSGADMLAVPEEDAELRAHDVTLRFHLHPRVQVKRLMNGAIALGAGHSEEEWIFHASIAQAVELEDSIYLGIDGKPHASRQIVVYAPYVPGVEWLVEWSFIKSTGM